MNSLQDITAAWGAWYSQQNGTTCRFTASTNYSEQSALANYMQYQVAATVQNLNYNGTTPPTDGAIIAYSLTYNNGTDVNQSEIFQQTETTDQTFTWSVTEAASIGIQISETTGVPGAASTGVKLTVTLSFSSTQSQTKSQTQTWQVNAPIIVPAHSSVEAQMSIKTETYNIPFTATILLNGYVAIWNNDKIDGHWLWFIPIGNVFLDCQANNIIDTAGYAFQGPTSVSVNATGVFTGSQGVGVTVNTKQTPLGATTPTTTNPLAFPAAAH